MSKSPNPQALSAPPQAHHAPTNASAAHSGSRSRAQSSASSAPATPVFVNDFVSNQKASCHSELVTAREARVLVLYTGGTIGMKNHRSEGYSPARGFLTETLKSMRRFNDPSANSASDESSSWAESAAPVVSYQPINLPMQYRYPGTLDREEIPIEEVKRGSSTSEPTVLINGTPVVRSHLPVLTTPRSLYGKRIRYSVLEYDPLLDSSNMTMKDWVKIATDIEVNYHLFDAFLVIHGTDTMAYTASALSFMLEDLGKSVILTGSQVPLSEVRNDAVENLLGALTIAGHFVIPEVSLFFAQKLFRGNRSSKVDAYAFAAFDSPNMRPLVEVSINIDVSWPDILKPTTIAKFKAEKRLNPSVATLRLFPGITEATVRAFLSPPIAGVVLESFGSGNAPSNRPDILAAFKEACDRGVVIVNCSQCLRGLVSDAYATGKQLASIGIVPGSDMTPECALTKLSYLLGKRIPVQECRSMMRSNLRGELTVRTKQMQFAYSLKTQVLSNAVLSIPRSASINDAKVEETGNASMGNIPEGPDGITDMLIPTVLCHAARNGDIDSLAEVCRQFGSFVSIGDYDGRTALHVAASENQYNAVEFLLLHGANVHQRDRYGRCPLFDAVRERHTEVARLLVQAGSHFVEEEIPEVSQLAAQAAFEGNIALIELLCECGANMNVPGRDGRNAVHMAVAGRQLGVLGFFVDYTKNLLKIGNDTSRSNFSATSGIEIKLDIKDYYGRTPLDDANSLGWVEGAHFLESSMTVLEMLKTGKD
ncbi:hypothetical protein HDU84_009522 [Entophlyctis sp. JEL0112]|nr:hypothetical protein HDU84_009522 [Entophlyctis sp. JEL0112]